jgi:ATP phosphoribosyltransferase
VIGEAGQSYGIRLENRTKKRLEVVLSVDGINTMSGKTASPSQRGYVLEPKETYEVEGYQKNQNTVRVFQFGRAADSVAATKGGANNVGVIGMAVFEEDEARAKAELQQEQFLRNGASAFPVTR